MSQARRPRRPARSRQRGPLTVGRVVARALADAGVEWAFTVPGESFLGLLDALPAAGIKVVATRHESGAAFMAEAIGQLTGRPAAVLGTRAVGAANMSIGIHTARQNSTPLVALVGQVPRDMLGREAFQEADLAGSFGRLAKWAAQLEDAPHASSLVAEGLNRMLDGRPGPVFFALPEDVIDVELAPGSEAAIERRPPPPPDPASVAAALQMLRVAERPAILAGGGVIASGGRDALVRLSERLAIPVFAAWRRPTAFPNEHPNYLGMTGYGSPPVVRERLFAADAMLVVGCRLSQIATFDYVIPSPAASWAHVDLEPRHAVSGLPDPDLAIAADAATFLQTAVELAGDEPPPAQRVGELAEARAAYLAATQIPEREGGRVAGVDPAHVVASLQSVLPADAILTTDAGNFGLWPARHFRFGSGMAFLGPTSGAMGYGLPAAIAANLARPDRRVVALCGDGGLGMTMNELETAVRAGTRPVVIVFDNRRYGTIAMHQTNERRSTRSTELGPIDFAAVARACGAQGGRVTRDVEFEPALRDALAADRPAVLQLELDPRWVTPDRFG